MTIYFLQVTFEAVRGQSYKSDIAVDDITITESRCAGRSDV